MDEMMKSLGLTTDPNNPYYTPPQFSELALRGLGAVAQPIAAQKSNTMTGALLRGGAGLAGGLAGAFGEEMAKRRAAAQFPAILNDAGAAVAQIKVPGLPGTPVEGPVMPGQSLPPLGATDPRSPESFAEALQYATPQQRFALLAANASKTLDTEKLFDPGKIQQGRYPLVKVRGDKATEIYGGDPSADALNEYQYRAARLADAVYRNPDDLSAQLQLAIFNKARASDPWSQEYYDQKINSIRARMGAAPQSPAAGSQSAIMPPPTPPQASTPGAAPIQLAPPPALPAPMSNEMGLILQGKAQAAANQAKMVEDAKVGVRGSPAAAAAERNIITARESAKLAIEASPAFLAAKEAASLATEQGKPLDDSTRQSVSAMAGAVGVAETIKSKFSKEERARYVGYFRYPIKQVSQLVNNDPRFAEFQALVSEAKSQAFGEGGKQLTQTERDIVFGYVPTGKEFSAADFEAKLDLSLARAQSVIERRIKLARTPRSEVRSEDFTKRRSTALPPPPPTKQSAPSAQKSKEERLKAIFGE